MFEPFQAAPTSAKVVNVFILLFLFLSWVSTMVTFGSVLHSLTDANVPNGPITADFYWNHLNIGIPGQSGNNIAYGQSAAAGPHMAAAMCASLFPWLI